MNDFRFEIASNRAEVNALFPSTQTYCTPYLTDSTTPDFSVTITPEDIAFERQKAAKEDALEGLPIRNLPDSLLEITALQRKIAEELFARNVLLFHGSVVAVDGVAYLFTAKSGTGKSTHTRLWRQVFGDRAVMVNDDKPFLEIREKGITVHGSPWNGKHRLGQNISLPLRAICILERGAENQIRAISPREALPMLMQQSQRPRDSRKLPLYLDLLDKLSSRVAFYRMQCNMDPQAAKVAYDAMCHKENPEKLEK